MEQTKIEFPPHILEEVNRVIQMFPEDKQKSALIRVLHIAQAQFGWLSTDVMDYVARLLHLNPIEVYEVVASAWTWDSDEAATPL